MKTTFGKGGRSWGKGTIISGLTSADVAEESQEREGDREHGRSHSVPPELDGSPTKMRKHRELPEDHEVFDGSEQVDNLDEEMGEMGAVLLAFGKGGWLKPSPIDPTLFILSIDGGEETFELSLMSHIEDATKIEGLMSDPEESGESVKVRGRRNRYGGLGGTQKIGKLGDVEAARLFSLGKIDFYRFLDDDDLVDDPTLVIRWAGDR